MSFIKRGDALPILTVETPVSDSEEEKAKIALDAAKQRAKNIGKDGNNTEFTVGSNS